MTCYLAWYSRRKAKDTNIYDKYKLPLKPSHQDDKHQFPLVNQQIEKHQGVWWKYQPSVSLCLCISSQYLTSLYGLSRSGVSSQCVSFFCGRLGFWLKIWHWCCRTWGELSQNSLQSLSWCAQSTRIGSSRYILALYGGLGNWRLFSRRPANKRRSKKMISTRSALSVNPTTRKIGIRKNQ
jgi:hypothetical protein